LVENGQFEAEKALLALEASRKEIIVSSSWKTIDDVFSKPTATLSTVKKYKGEETMKAVIEALIISTAAAVNVGKGLKEAQIEMAVDLIFSEYYWLTVADLKVCFRNAIMGKYGQMYDRMDVAMIMDWLNQYSEERAAHSIAISQSGTRKEGGVLMPEWFGEKLEKWTKRAMTPKISTQPREGQRPAKFSTLSAWLDSIGKNDEVTRKGLQGLWLQELKDSNREAEEESWIIYKANQLLCEINSGKELPEQVKKIIEKN